MSDLKVLEKIKKLKFDFELKLCYNITVNK